MSRYYRIKSIITIVTFRYSEINYYDIMYQLFFHPWDERGHPMDERKVGLLLVCYKMTITETMCPRCASAIQAAVVTNVSAWVIFVSGNWTFIISGKDSLSITCKYKITQRNLQALIIKNTHTKVKHTTQMHQTFKTQDMYMSRNNFCLAITNSPTPLLGGKHEIKVHYR